MKRPIKAAVYTGARNLYPEMIPAVKSLMTHSDVEKIYLMIEDDEFPYWLPKEVETINVSGQQYFKSDGPNMKSRFTYMAMMRATLAKEFPDLDQILSLDVDTIVNKDICNIWDLPIDDYYFAAAREPDRCKNGEIYCNIGVTLYNLKKLREDGKADEAIEALNTDHYKYLDQDVFNKYCQGGIYIMPADYNVTDFTDKPEVMRIIHYAGIREWKDIPLVNQYRRASWEGVLNYRKRMGYAKPPVRDENTIGYEGVTEK